ncbi:hypothetical protein [Paenibacillus periandrae]|uniref:CDI toxin immunity protein n=1 Tax=Paenibacillus periandrae TaxID=1761741 RepID=UPI001F09162A|nr:hypothetical protein [Paenibacillus periandrae]
MTLFEECVEALGNGIKILSEQEAKKILTQFQIDFPLNQFLRVQWENYINKIIINNSVQLSSEIKENIALYIIWDNARLPIIHTDLFSVIKVIDDVTAVSFDTWLYSPENKFLVEFHHDGKITICNK